MLDPEKDAHRPLRLPEYKYDTPGYYFVTFNARPRGEDILSHISPEPPASVGPPAHGRPAPSITLTPTGEIVNTLIQNIDHVYRDVSVDCYVIMPDHVHMILVLGCHDINRDGRRWAGGPTDKQTPLSTVINSLKTLTTKRIGRSIWQSRFYDHVLRNDADLRETRQYIENNPLKARL